MNLFGEQPAMMKTRSSLLRRLRNPADIEGWREFVALYQPLLLAYVRRQGWSGPDADDVVQDVLARLVHALPEFELKRQRGRFRTWLWRLTRNLLIDRARREHHRVLAERATAEPQAMEPAEREEPDADWQALHRRRVLEFAKAQVRARCRHQTWACFEGYVLRGQPCADVAAELGVTPNVVAVNSSRVLARLRDYCRDYLEGLADGDDLLPG
jgi:RNA polymerase sigma-70 factor (ECF subfamily)